MILTHLTMDNAALFRVQTEVTKRVKAAMEQHKLPKDSVGAYKYNNPPHALKHRMSA